MYLLLQNAINLTFFIHTQIVNNRSTLNKMNRGRVNIFYSTLETLLTWVNRFHTKATFLVDF